MLELDADSWAAWAQWATFAVAALAALYAKQQVDQARSTQDAVAQPNVVAYVDRNADDWQYIDFVIKNFGETPAYNIRVTLPNLELVPYDNSVTGDTQTTLDIPNHLVVLAPGQEWRTMWDSAIELAEHKSNLDLEKLGRYHGPPIKPIQSVFVGHVEFQDRNKKEHLNPIYLDKMIFKNTLRIGKRDNPS